MMNMMLLEPYRTALFSIGITEGLVPIPKNVYSEEITSTSTFAIGTDKILQRRLCQLLILFDQVSIIHHETEELQRELEERGTPGLSAKQLKDLGLVAFAQPPQGGEHRLSALKSAEQTLEGIWAVEKPLLEIWEPAILGQMQAKAKLPHPSVYHLLKAKRLGTRSDVERVLPSIPSDARPFADLLLQDKIPMWDFVIFSTLNELIGAEEIVTKGEWSIASEAMYHAVGSLPEKSLALDVFEIVLRDLLECDFDFPVCETLRDVIGLRAKSEVAEFRGAFFPWLVSFSAGDSASERRLRKEVRKVVLAFKHHGKVSKLGWLVAFAAIPAGFIEPFTGAGLSVLGLGLPALANRWKNKSKWLGLCARK